MQTPFATEETKSPTPYPGGQRLKKADLPREREGQLTKARANQTNDLTNSRAANWAPEVVCSPFRALSRRKLTFPFCCLISLMKQSPIPQKNIPPL